MVYCRMDGKETDSQRDEEHEAEIVDVDFWSVYFLWICGDQKLYWCTSLDMIIWETSFITQNLIKYLSQIKSAIFFVIEKDGTF